MQSTIEQQTLICDACHRVETGWSALGRSHYRAEHALCARCGLEAMCFPCDCSRSEQMVGSPVGHVVAAMDVDLTEPSLAFTADKGWHLADDLERLQSLRDHAKAKAGFHQALADAAEQDAANCQQALDLMLAVSEAS